MTKATLRHLIGATRQCISSLLLIGSLTTLAPLLLRAAHAQEGTILQLTDVRIDEPAGDFKSVSNGSVTLTNPNYTGQYTWNPPPERIGPEGFTLTLNAAGQVTAGNLYAQTSAGGSGFVFDPAEALVGVFPQAGESKSDSISIKVTPIAGMTPGGTATLNVGASWGRGVTYTYQVVGSGGGGVEEDGKLAVDLECPGEIVISQMPMLQCALIFRSWHRNTSRPVDVSLPDAIDFYGNHANGIQVSQIVGNEDIFNWDAPHRWPFSVFACPSQSHVGANCYSSVTTPGMNTVVIIVRQGDDVVRIELVLNALPGAGHQVGAKACGHTLGTGIHAKWLATGGEQGFLGCATSDELEAGRSPYGTAGKYAQFVGGVIVWHGDGRLSGTSFAVQGCVATLYQNMGGTNSWLGLPTSDEFDAPGGRISVFEGGYIAWDSSNSNCSAYRDGASAFTFEPDINRAGADFRDFEMMADRLELCRDSCAANNSCVAYTYVRPGLQGPKPHCWLKSSVPAPSQNGCCVSGIRN